MDINLDNLSYFQISYIAVRIVITQKRLYFLY